MPPARAPTASADAAHCPLCGGANACEMEQARREGRAPGACWCMQVEVPAALLARVPAQDRGQRCVCAACVRAEGRGSAG